MRSIVFRIYMSTTSTGSTRLASLSILIPKKDDAKDISDFQPISLIHAIANIIAKMMATRLAPHMPALVSNTQSCFNSEKKYLRQFHVRSQLRPPIPPNQVPTLLLKLDIKKAFDSVRWDYLMDLLRHHHFLSRFCDWISPLLSTASSRVLLNDVAGDQSNMGVGCGRGIPSPPYSLSLPLIPYTVSLPRLLNRATCIPSVATLFEPPYMPTMWPSSSLLSKKISNS